ncbi:cobyrinate a,c-diamide synthase [Clostridium luticellarii]|jgi:cobyrinic acid a,c-diamide synthase|uniref:cobyrinate a,c-diamide synthase n=1 Tax=Clostridium luticellarii TaxID=1691940 RepID=UPI0023554AD5|nr:cobyrinate a,c-diamide synthase [Clostridium luticellarii]MCI1968992.1 cobyrinate a,c-diamide synthase [Clostridium luticellarii]MCI1994585.1 cobyrinate a,c-diamide synthase [Clostridium luticellarii]MCI2038918.1 cobyrinate a,c-diamide synthase [Clostridium luticellarii]
MKSIVISSDSSGGGKTTVTLGIMKALIKRGYKVQGYKVGPDYIDPAFHKSITGTASRNLDLYLMGENGVKASFSRGRGDLGIVEGVMGLYDGKGIDSEYSTANVARVLDLPVVLVISPKSQSTTLCAEINGIVNFESINICGIIFNNIGESYYKLLKAAVEKNCNLKVFGYIPADERLSLKSRHLGLVQSSEVEDLNEKIELCSELILKNVNLEILLKYFKEGPDFRDEYHLKNRNIRTAVPYDKAFSFYYKENIELLEEAGEIVFFSPLKDKSLPENIDFLYIGGGYPEVFVKELSRNRSMLESINKKLKSGLACYAECGGLMYLMGGIEDAEEKRVLNTVGFFSGNAYMTSKLQNFGYAQIEVTEKNNILPLGFKINCHEFHKSYIESDEKKIYTLNKDTYNGKIKKWNCGYVNKNTLGAYAHIHFFGNLNIIKQILKNIKNKGE